MLRKLFIGIACLVGLIALVIGALWLVTEPKPLPEGTESARRLAAGPFAVNTVDYRWNDANRDITITLWRPEEASEKRPLLLFSHGFMSTREGCTHMAKHLSSYGYFVACVEHPFSNANAPDGPNEFDVVNQPSDLSFVLDQILKEGSVEFDLVDPDRIGAFGISLGANTVTLAAFHPEWREPRLKAVVSVVGHGDVFGQSFFQTANIPFLMIAGTADNIVPYETNAVHIPDRIQVGGLLTVEGATHAGFSYITSGPLRILGNPDNLGCGGASPEDIPQDESPFVGKFGTQQQGLIIPTEYKPPCSSTFSNVMKAGRQQDIATLAIRAFFGSIFATSANERQAHREYLELTILEELPSVSFRGAVGG